MNVEYSSNTYVTPLENWQYGNVIYQLQYI